MAAAADKRHAEGEKALELFSVYRPQERKKKKETRMAQAQAQQLQALAEYIVKEYYQRLNNSPESLTQ